MTPKRRWMPTLLAALTVAAVAAAPATGATPDTAVEAAVDGSGAAQGATLAGVDAAAARRGCPRVRRGRHRRCPLRALVLGRASSPALTALRRRLGRRIAVRATGSVPRRRRAARRFDMLVVDGDVVSPRRLRRTPLIGRFVAAGRWVLVLDARRPHRRGIERHTGLGIPSSGPARVFLFRHSRVGGTPTIASVEARSLRPRGARRLADRPARRRALRRETTRLGTVLARHATGRVRPATGATGGDGIPPEAQRVVWSHQETGSNHPRDGYWYEGRQDPLTGAEADGRLDEAGHNFGPAPAPGSQTASWTANHTFTAYLDNANRPEGNFQVVTYDLDGTFSPKLSGESFWHMYEQWRVIFGKQYLERAWWTGLIEPSIQPVEASDARLGWQANEPSTENSTTKYTSGQDFKIGASVTTEKAAEASVEYEISNETERDIPDWGVSSVTNGNAVSWFFSSRNCDPRSGAEGGSGWETSCFDIGAGKPGTPSLPNELSRGQNEFHASARWVTKRNGQQGLLDGADGKLGFRVRAPVQLIDTYCEGWGLFACAANKHRLQRDTSGPNVAVYTIDVGDVLPRKIESVELSPNPADGSQAEDVTGTIVLTEPVPFETTLTVFSNEDQAVVGTPQSDKVSRASVKIPAGKSRGTFKVETNDNGLAKGKHITATITIFYAGSPHPQRLCVVTRAGDSCKS